MPALIGSIVSTMTRRFTGSIKRFQECGGVVWLEDVARFGYSGTGFLVKLAERVAFAAFICLLTLGGAIGGTIVGAFKGQTTRTGFLTGARTGTLTGAVAAIHLLESAANSEPSSKMVLLTSLLEGKIFMEWVSIVESAYLELSDIHDVPSANGLSKKCIQGLPLCKFHFSTRGVARSSMSCAICLEDLKDGQVGRELPICGHMFHLQCIDQWLIVKGSCPTCRSLVCNDLIALQTDIYD